MRFIVVHDCVNNHFADILSKSASPESVLIFVLNIEEIIFIKMTFILNKYRDKVFMANRMIVSDLKQNPQFETIKNTNEI